MITIIVSIILGILIAGVKAHNNTEPIEKAKIAVGNAVENLIKSIFTFLKPVYAIYF